MIAQLTPEYVQRRPLQALKRLIGYGLFEGRAALQRGRWINPLVFAHLALEVRLPQFRRVVRPAFIVGLGRSGTTILSHVLSYHRDIGSLNEPKALWHMIHPRDDLIGSYSRTPGRYRLDAGDATEEVKRRAHRLYGAYLFATATRRVVDKYPEMLFRIPFLRAVFPDARFLLVTRNGRDVCGSIAAWTGAEAVRSEGHVEDWWGVNDRKWRLLVDEVVTGDTELSPHRDTIRALNRPTDRAAVEWIVTMREGLRWLADAPDTVLRVPYEELIESSDAVLRDVMAFLDVKDDPGVTAYARGVLRSPPPYEPAALDPVLRPPFDATMAALGYGSAKGANA